MSEESETIKLKLKENPSENISKEIFSTLQRPSLAEKVELTYHSKQGEESWTELEITVSTQNKGKVLQILREMRIFY